MVESSKDFEPGAWRTGTSRVLVHEQGIAAADSLLLDLENEPNLGIRRSLKPLALPRDALEFLAPRPRVAYFFEPAHELEAEAIG